MKKTTLQDIANAAGVSSAAVSMILNQRNLSRFSDETIHKVYQTCRELSYIPKNKQHYKNRKNVILIICPSLMNPYYTTLIQSMEQEATQLGFLTLIYTTYWDKNAEKEILELAANPNIAGIIFSMIPQHPQWAEATAARIPMVTIGDLDSDLKIDTVDVNNYNAGCLIADHLISLGHRHVAYISTSLNEEHSSRVKRCKGLTDRYAEACPQGSVCVYTQEVSSQRELHILDIEHEVGYQLAIRCLKESPQVTAMVAINDMVAYGVMDALIDSGKRIPEDISVCGFDNIYPSRFHRVSLTSIEHPIEERGRRSVRLLSEKLKGGFSLIDDNFITKIEYQGRLMKRGSTGPNSSTDGTA